MTEVYLRLSSHEMVLDIPDGVTLLGLAHLSLQEVILHGRQVVVH